MNDLKGTINYLRALRDYCNKAESCKDCELRTADVCTYHYPPQTWSDDRILKMIKLTGAYTELIKGMEGGE